jgi:hypothetical protein
LAFRPDSLRGLDIGRFEAELLAGAYTLRVREDFMSGVRSGQSGTPTFFINGLRYDGSWDASDLLAAARRVSCQSAGERPGGRLANCGSGEAQDRASDRPDAVRITELSHRSPPRPTFQLGRS